MATSPAGAASPIRPEPASSLTVQQLERRLKKLEEEISHLVAKHPQIHIDTLHVHQPVLENLTFRLDHLDIKELSGSLNLGNNFGAKPNEKKGPLDEAYKHAQVSKEPSTAFRSSSSEESPASAESGSGRKGSSSDGAAPSPERTTTGYRYTPQSKTK
ncbi:hypothetical protein [Paenibacillus aceris]|uniref:Uncharacterized protein n=1 Tax=Paenibacillus aceris TaxID=869555 RepID=A0ABS4I9I6_9BACL|nr:hypothetical protein [Paenibacillus aceris]MBP1967589.1 hypothetical protein [Paenibacillus aceris]NHW39152.1 hypothetical protein [Paenibacillus aceris]